MLIDAENHVLGRLSTHVVQRLKDGDEVDIVNADKAIVKGNPDSIVEKYRQKYELGDKDFGPRYPKAAEKIVRRTVQGMLPNGAEGREMLGNLKVYTGKPDRLDGETETVEDAREETLQGSNYMTMQEIADNLGA
ncbi:MAG: 50S ribosomal protein L13 [Candidatus Nanohaloarchaea archaeon]|nr:50S ribosomal protein L13 [Candidatus Nanohaloarchaea archaeon]